MIGLTLQHLKIKELQQLTHTHNMLKSTL